MVLHPAEPRPVTRMPLMPRRQEYVGSIDIDTPNRSVLAAILHPKSVKGCRVAKKTPFGRLSLKG